MEARISMPHPQRFTVEVDGQTVVNDCMNLVDALDIVTWHIALMLEDNDWTHGDSVLINAEACTHDSQTK